MINYYVNSIKEFCDKFEEAANFYGDLASKISQLLTVLSESKGDDIEKIINDLRKYQTKFINVKDAINSQKEKINQRAIIYDGWYKNYVIMLNIASEYQETINGEKYNVKERIIDLFVGEDGLINIKRSFEKEKQLNFLESIGAIFGGKNISDTVETEKISEMKNFTGGYYVSSLRAIIDLNKD